MANKLKFFRRGPGLLTIVPLFLVLVAACLPVTTKSSGRPDGQSLLSQAETAYAQGQYGLAADYYRQALASGDPENLETVLAGYGLAAEKAGRFSEAAQAYERLISRFPAGEFADESRRRLLYVYTAGGDDDPADLGGRLPPGGVTLAVLLPLSDKKGAGRFAQEVARGLELAVNELGAGRVGLTVLDTGGAPAQAAHLVGLAAADPRILAAVGPMLREESMAAAEAAGRTDLPLIVISQAPDLPRTKPNVFRLFLTPRHQAEALARYAVRAQNHQDLGIIYPDDNYGRAVLAAFQAEAARLGARVTVAERYSPKNPDLEAMVSRITGGRAAARRVSTDYQAKMDCSILFLPDSPGPVAQLLPLLAFHDVTRMPLLGSSLWLDAPDFLAASARYLQDAAIPAPFSDLSQRPESRNFSERFQRAYGHVPHQFAAYGYDAGLALIRALAQGAGSREALGLALAWGGIIPGATGPFNFDQDGEYQTEPALLTVEEREFVLLREPERAH